MFGGAENRSDAAFIVIFEEMSPSRQSIEGPVADGRFFGRNRFEQVAFHTG
jgi:hypothetical protein